MPCSSFSSVISTSSEVTKQCSGVMRCWTRYLNLNSRWFMLLSINSTTSHLFLFREGCEQHTIDGQSERGLNAERGWTTHRSEQDEERNVEKNKNAQIALQRRMKRKQVELAECEWWWRSKREMEQWRNNLVSKWNHVWLTKAREMHAFSLKIWLCL